MGAVTNLNVPNYNKKCTSNLPYFLLFLTLDIIQLAPFVSTSDFSQEVSRSREEKIVFSTTLTTASEVSPKQEMMENMNQTCLSFTLLDNPYTAQLTKILAVLLHLNQSVL
ncbi:hypothetical protein XENOCAPTIV_025736 [Xenoophorus captivus]|uniref:Uncharacterized protein n=1 Tax=Xenoophorus captivus TaxID=1517983 RepID=A0ABV0SH33_9TELE